MPHQIRHHSIRCRADEYGATWHVMPDDMEVLAYTREDALEAWRSYRADRMNAVLGTLESQDMLF